jgi:serine/threonine protein kinase
VKAFAFSHRVVPSQLNGVEILIYLRHHRTCSSDFVLELAPGGELFDLIKRFGRMPEALVAHIGAELAGALAYMRTHYAPELASRSVFHAPYCKVFIFSHSTFSCAI